MGATIDKYVTGRRNPIGSVVLGPRLIDAPITPRGQDGGFLGAIHAPFRVTDATQPLDKIAAMSPPETGCRIDSPLPTTGNSGQKRIILTR